ncbi:hypothetical protein [Parapusillimonas granuli]|uniref:hypothetical protein n=1 Tax=Parapusillimonas granuli TaxID=380911 RepID=UPI00181535EB|nr:hypothetical protein [Parapusillimonas granuli]MBB5217536.1 hypothetical protein [Parapusillimonas granuli]
MMAADSLRSGVPSGMSFRRLLPCRRACRAGAFAPHGALPSAQPSNGQASCLERARPAAIAAFAGALTSRPGLPVRIIVNRDLVLRPYQPLFFNKRTSR